MLTIKKINDRKTSKTHVVIKASYIEALRLDGFLLEMTKRDDFGIQTDLTQSFIKELQDNLHTILYY